jgi:hypothetical protein
MTFLANYPGNKVVRHQTGAGERVHQNVPDYLPFGFAVSWMRLAPKGFAVRG